MKFILYVNISFFKGLCGLYNTNKSDDIRLPNGTVIDEPSLANGQRGLPKTFSKSWQ